MKNRRRSPCDSRDGNPFRSLAVWAIALLVVLSLVLPASAISLGSFTVADERELGEKFAVLVKSKLPLVEDPEIKSYVTDLVQNLASQMPAQPWPLEVNVVRHNALNAFAAPAGYIFVFTGLILNVEHESELAGVLAHELAHVSQRHIAERIEQAQIVNLASLLGMLSGAVLGGEEGYALTAGSLAAGQSAMLSYSRRNETEADQIGMQYLLKSGYNPNGLVEAFEALKRKQWYIGSTIPAYLSTHPGLDERIGSLGAWVERMPPEVRNRKENDARFRRVQTLVRARYTDQQLGLAHYDSMDPAKMACLDHLGHGVVLARANRIQQARNSLDKALECGSNDPLVQREAGRFLFEQGSLDEAGKHLQKAVILAPDDLMAIFFYARLLAAKGEPDRAVDYMSRVARHLPEDAEVHLYLGRMYGQSGRLFEAHLQLAYAALYQNDPKQTAFHRKKAESLAESAVERGELDKFRERYQERSQFWE